MPNEIAVRRVGDVIARTLRMAEPSPAGVLGAEVIATLPIEVDRPEWRALGGTYHFAAAVSTGAVVGFFSDMLFFNPPASRIVAVIYKIDFQPATLTDFITIYLGLTVDPAAATPVAGFQRDQRCINRATPFVGRRSVCGIQAFGAAGVPAGGAAIVKGPATITQRIELIDHPLDWIICPPGTGFVVIPNLVTNSGNANFSWYERELEPSEFAIL